MIALVSGLALRDALHDRRLFFCFAAALAAVLAPLIVLLGLKQGVVAALRHDLVENPRTREVLNIGNRGFDAAWFERWRARKEIAFLVPRTRSIAATLYLERDDGVAGQVVTTELIPTAPGDPLLVGLPADGDVNAIVLSETAAQKLGIVSGDAVLGSAIRTVDGKRERAQWRLRVAAIAPIAAFPRDGLFAALPALLTVEDFGDGRLGATPALGETAGTDGRLYAGFRLYARRIEDVAAIAAALAAEGVETRTRADEIEGILLLDRNLSIIFLIIAAIGSVGYLLSLAVSLWANVERKLRDLSVIRLLGLTSGSLVVFPIVQGGLIALIGAAAAAAVALGVAVAINTLYVTGLPAGSPICLLTVPSLVAMACVTLAAAIVASALAAWRIAGIAPAEGIRDV
jgi:putative ABC transport system permease protein